MAAKDKRSSDKKSESGEVRRAPSVSELEEEEMLGPKKPKAEGTGKSKGSDKADKAGRNSVFPKSGGKLRLFLVVTLVWLIIFSAAVLLIVYDPTEDAFIRGTVLLFLNPEEDDLDEYYKDMAFELQEKEKELYDQEILLNQRSDELDLYEEQLAEREGLLEDREYETESLYESLLAAGSIAGGVAPDPVKAAKNLGLMKPANAAMALEGMDFDTALRLCTLMSDKKLSPILDVLDPELCAQIIEAMGTPEEVDEDW